MHNGEKIALVIPALNEALSVGDVIRSFLALRNNDGSPIIDLVVVGDNGSTDRTPEIATSAGARVVFEHRRGYGAACLAAISALPPEIGIIVFADADRSDEPSELPNFLAALDSGADLVIGSRALGKAEPGSLTPQQLFGNWLAAFLIRMIWKHPITDLGPFRAVRRSAYEQLGMADRTYGWTVEMQVKAIQAGLAVAEVPASYHRRVGVSKISGTVRGTIGAGTKILGMIAHLWYRERIAGVRGRLIAPTLTLIVATLLWFAFPCRVYPDSDRSNIGSAPALFLQASPSFATRPLDESNVSVRWSASSLKGIALGLHEGDSYDYRPTIDEIAGVGADAIEFVIPYYQRNARAADPGPKPGTTPSLEVIVAAVRHARERGLEVHLLPIVLLESADSDEWRGVMKPDDADSWWRNYGRLIEDLARLAQTENVRALSVGSELLWSESMRNRWIAVIDAARRQFHGTLLYSANWDHYRPVKFWDRLDVIGISGYYELTRDSEASFDALRSSWETVKIEVLAWRKHIGKPLLFTEIGYPAIDGGAVYPWNYTIQGRADEEEQRRALSAFLTTWRSEPDLEGAFLYEWGISDRGGSSYSPRGRLAEGFVRTWMKPDHEKEK